MAIEFDWYGDASVDTPTLRAFVATTTGGRPHPDGTIFIDGMYVVAKSVSQDDEGDDVIAAFGFDERFSATFHFSNLAAAAVADHNAAVMVHVIIAFTQSYGGSGVLLFNGERNVLQYGPDGVTVASDWEDWTENREVAPLLSQLPSRKLSQPLL